MAYMSQEKKAKIAAALKAVVPKGWKYTLAVRHHSTIVMTISEADIDLIGDWYELAKSRGPMLAPRLEAGKPDHLSINPYWYREHFSPEIVALLDPIFAALNDGNHDNSDHQSDYFDVGWYVDVDLGRWNKPFKAPQPIDPPLEGRYHGPIEPPCYYEPGEVW